MLAGRIEPSQPSQSQVEESLAMAALPDEVDAARAREYALLAALLARTPDRQLLEAIAAFVAEHPAEHSFAKRERDRADPEALGRRVPTRKGRQA